MLGEIKTGRKETLMSSVIQRMYICACILCCPSWYCDPGGCSYLCGWLPYLVFFSVATYWLTGNSVQRLSTPHASPQREKGERKGKEKERERKWTNYSPILLHVLGIKFWSLPSWKELHVYMSPPPRFTFPPLNPAAPISMRTALLWPCEKQFRCS